MSSAEFCHTCNSCEQNNSISFPHINAIGKCIKKISACNMALESEMHRNVVVVTVNKLLCSTLNFL